ncbi:MAG: dienelactone hydrolase family protein [Acidobacteria bacterium]|nr:dienelactone hydrolase family protein [Acidobacteriota bacterium]MCA1643026.1 dienelactone hydrolase family protein [Acidobacteriota bacterium]
MCFKDDCNEDATGRRSFLLSATASLAGFAAARGQGMSPQARQPETRVLDDARVQHGRVVFRHNGADSIDGFLARPKAEGAYPAVLVIAGNKINEEYIPNTCAALALAGFVGLAPNIFHPLPGDTPINAEPYDKYIANHTDLDKLDDIQAGASYLRAQAFVRAGAMGVLGFCSGGRLALLHGARSRDIDAVVAFHPAPMKEGEVARLKVPVQIHHGTADQAVAFAESVKLEKVLKAQRTPVELFAYEGADHGFLAYTRPFYKPDYAKLAWSRATQFLRGRLG